MNLYLLVEGKQTERKVYPKWLSILLPEFQQVKSLKEVKDRNFYLFSGEGFPSLLYNHLTNAVSDINKTKAFDYLVLCLDSDDSTVEERKNEVITFIKEKEIKLVDTCRLVLIVQNRCIETWFLGNRKTFKRNPSQQPLISYVNFYNVRDNDPELMPGHNHFLTISQFHHSYLKQNLLERNIRYTKNNPGDVGEKHYLLELIDRINETGHLQSLNTFLSFCNDIKKTLD